MESIKFLKLALQYESKEYRHKTAMKVKLVSGQSVVRSTQYQTLSKQSSETPHNSVT